MGVVKILLLCVRCCGFGMRRCGSGWDVVGLFDMLWVGVRCALA